MPSPTGVTRLVRNKKKSLNGKRSKRENRLKGTWNYMTKGFPSEVQAASTSAKK